MNLFKKVFIIFLCWQLIACDSNDDSTSQASQIVALSGQPNGAWWDVLNQILYISDETNNSLIRWTESGFLSNVSLPAIAANLGGLGQVVSLEDGQVLVTRFGYGSAGTVLHVNAQGKSYATQGLDPVQRRIGITVDEQGQLFDCGFIRNADGSRTSIVNRLSLIANSSTLAAQETEVIRGTGKIVGCVANAGVLYLTDQDNNQVLFGIISELTRSVSLNSLKVLANVKQPDLLTVAHDGSLFMGGYNGTVYRVRLNGEVIEFAKGFRQVRGVAYDKGRKRLFVLDRNTDTSSTASPHLLHIIPVND